MTPLCSNINKKKSLIFYNWIFIIEVLFIIKYKKVIYNISIELNIHIQTKTLTIKKTHPIHRFRWLLIYWIIV